MAYTPEGFSEQPFEVDPRLVEKALAHAFSRRDQSAGFSEDGNMVRLPSSHVVPLPGAPAFGAVSSYSTYAPPVAEPQEGHTLPPCRQPDDERMVSAPQDVVSGNVLRKVHDSYVAMRERRLGRWAIMYGLGYVFYAGATAAAGSMNGPTTYVHDTANFAYGVVHVGTDIAHVGKGVAGLVGKL